MRIVIKLLQEYCNLVETKEYENSFEAFNKWQYEKLKNRGMSNER